MKYLIYLRGFSVLFIGMILTSCSFFSPVKVTPLATYMVATVPCVPVVKRSHKKIILVMQPEVIPALNTTKMAYFCRPFQMAYFVKNQWAETPGQMLQTIMVQALQNTHYFKAVVTPPFLGHYDYVLTTQILQFQQEYLENPAQFTLSMRAQLIRALPNKVIATRYFCITEPLCQNNPYEGVLAANIAAARLTKKLTAFSLLHIK